MTQKPCNEGGDLHWPRVQSRWSREDGSFTAVCGSCEKELYASGLGVQWVVVSDVIKEEPW